MPFTWLRSRLGLTEDEETVLWLLLGAELCPDLRRRVRALATEEVLDPTVDVVRRIVYNHAADRAAWRELGPTGSLHRFLLVESDTRNGSATTTLRLSSRVLALAHGELDLDPALTGILASPAVPAGELVLPGTTREQIATAVGIDRNLVVVTGARGIGKRSALVRAAADGGRQPVVVDARGLSKDPGAAGRQSAAVARDCVLLAKTPIVVDSDHLSVEILALLDRGFERLPGPVLATAATMPAFRSTRSVTTIAMPRLDAAEQRSMWRLALPGASEVFIDTVAEAYPVAPSLAHAVGHRVMSCAIGSPITVEVVGDAVAAIVGDRLGPLAPRIEVTQTWQDAVLAPDQRRGLIELLARVQCRSKVFETWGFGRKVGRGLGVAALFSGPPGTGKTMAAGLIAKDLGLPLHQVDLSQIESKWIGETEKNLAALFDAAEACHAVILFDEADALFAKRTEVQTSNDRHANQTVNYLLQRIERFTGVCILTTNHDTAIDGAFRRRLAAHIRFELPDEDERAVMWRAMIPDTAEIAGEIDFVALARRFKMPGGNIRNAVVRAAFLAADQNRPIDHKRLALAACLEYEAMGRLVSTADFDEDADRAR